MLLLSIKIIDYITKKCNSQKGLHFFLFFKRLQISIFVQ